MQLRILGEVPFSRADIDATWLTTVLKDAGVLEGGKVEAFDTKIAILGFRSEK